jgi:hypothetical protein
MKRRRANFENKKIAVFICEFEPLCVQRSQIRLANQPREMVDVRDFKMKKWER